MQSPAETRSAPGANRLHLDVGVEAEDEVAAGWIDPPRVTTPIDSSRELAIDPDPVTSGFRSVRDGSRSAPCDPEAPVNCEAPLNRSPPRVGTPALAGDAQRSISSRSEVRAATAVRAF